MGGGARFSAGGSGPGGFEDVFGGMFGGGGQRMRFQQNPDDLFSGLFGGGAGFTGQPRPNTRKGADLTANITIDFRTAIQGGEVSLDIRGQKPLQIAIPAGVNDKQKIRVRGKGEQSMTGGVGGDLVITVTVRDHPVFDRDGDNLRIDIPITIPEAILGATIEVPTLEGDRVKVKVPANTPSGRVLRVRDRGVNVKGKRGDLLATILIVTPDLISDKTKKLIEEFKTLNGDANPRDPLYGKASH
jgi:molecular chaperone DnaJ